MPSVEYCPVYPSPPLLNLFSDGLKIHDLGCWHSLEGDTYIVTLLQDLQTPLAVLRFNQYRVRWPGSPCGLVSRVCTPIQRPALTGRLPRTHTRLSPGMTVSTGLLLLRTAVRLRPSVDLAAWEPPGCLLVRQVLSVNHRSRRILLVGGLGVLAGITRRTHLTMSWFMTLFVFAQNFWYA